LEIILEKNKITLDWFHKKTFSGRQEYELLQILQELTSEVIHINLYCTPGVWHTPTMLERRKYINIANL